MENEGTYNLRFGGSPTGPFVDAIIEKYPPDNMNIGDTIGYDDIEGIIEISHENNRFRTITNQWRKKMDRLYNVIFSCSDNKFEVLSNSKRVDLSSSNLKSGLKKMVRASNIASRTDVKGLSSMECKARDHIINLGATIKTIAQTEQRKLTFELKDIADK